MLPRTRGYLIAPDLAGEWCPVRLDSNPRWAAEAGAKVGETATSEIIRGLHSFLAAVASTEHHAKQTEGERATAFTYCQDISDHGETGYPAPQPDR